VRQVASDNGIEGKRRPAAASRASGVREGVEAKNKRGEPN